MFSVPRLPRAGASRHGDGSGASASLAGSSSPSSRGGGTRARHIYSIASELEMPTGVLAALGGYVPRQNARMVQMLLAKHGGLFILHDDFEKLPLYFALGCLPIMTGMPLLTYKSVNC